MELFDRRRAIAVCVGGLLTSSLRADPDLIAAAKEEGSVTWYSIQVVDQLVRPVASAFTKKYGVKVNYVRANPADVALRVLNESRAGHVQADVVDGTQACAGLKAQGVLAHWLPPAASAVGKQFVDPDGYWVASNYYVLAAAYNTDLVSKGSEPESWDALLDPKWKGKMVWNTNATTSAAAGVVGLMLRARGESAGMDFLRRLAAQNVIGVKVSARQVLDEVIAGEYAIGLQVYPNAIAFSAAKGAPIARILLQPALGAMVGVATTKEAPHPNAAKLLVEFLLSNEGQTIYRDNDYLPVRPGIGLRDPSLDPAAGRTHTIFVNPDQENDALPKWTEIASSLFR